MHPLLARQIRKKLRTVDITSPEWADFIAAVDEAYTQADQDGEFNERTLDVVSEELTAANERIRREAEATPAEPTEAIEPVAPPVTEETDLDKALGSQKTDFTLETATAGKKDTVSKFDDLFN